MILLDTNVLVYAVDESSPFHTPCHEVVSRAMSGKLNAVLVPQVLLEFYAVVTSPRRVRSPLAAAEGILQVMDWRRSISVRYPTARCLEEWALLAGQCERVGQETHDLFLAAQMRAHGIPDLCTLNAGDFAGIKGINAHHPNDI